MIAKAYGQDPRSVATWEPDWLAACSTALAAEAGAANERQRRADRQRRAHAGGRG